MAVSVCLNGIDHNNFYVSARLVMLGLLDYTLTPKATRFVLSSVCTVCIHVYVVCNIYIIYSYCFDDHISYLVIIMHL